MAGVKVPLVAMHHAYVVTERIEGIQVGRWPQALSGCGRLACGVARGPSCEPSPCRRSDPRGFPYHSELLHLICEVGMVSQCFRWCENEWGSTRVTPVVPTPSDFKAQLLADAQAWPAWCWAARSCTPGVLGTPECLPDPKHALGANLRGHCSPSLRTFLGAPVMPLQGRRGPMGPFPLYPF